MRLYLLRLAIFLCAGGLLASCAGTGSGGGLTPPASQNQSVSSARLGQISNANPKLLWYSYCNLCGIVGAGGTVNVDANSATTGALIHELTFQERPEGPGAPTLVATSPDQQHVYAAILRGGGNYIADINPQTYAVRYFKIPVLFTQGTFSGLVVSPDGTRLYAPIVFNAGGGMLYAINTVTRTYAGTLSIALSDPAISTDGHTLYGVSATGLTAITTSTLGVKVFAPAPSFVTSMAASSARLYVGEQTTINMYATSTLKSAGVISVPSFPNSLVIDNAESRLYAWINGATTTSTLIIDTATNAVLKTIHGGTLAAVDPITHVLWVTTPFGQKLCAIQPVTYSESCLPQTPAGTLQQGNLTTTN